MAVDSLQIVSALENESSSHNKYFPEEEEETIFSDELDTPVPELLRKRPLWTSSSRLTVYESCKDFRSLCKEESVPVAARALYMSDTDLAPELQVHRAFVRTDLLERLRGGGASGGISRHEGLLLAVSSCGAVLDEAEEDCVGGLAAALPAAAPRLLPGLPSPYAPGAWRDAAAAAVPSRTDAPEAAAGPPSQAPLRPLAEAALPEQPDGDEEGAYEFVDILRPRVFASGSRHFADAHPRRLFPLSQNVKNMLFKRSLQHNLS